MHHGPVNQSPWSDTPVTLESLHVCRVLGFFAPWTMVQFAGFFEEKETQCSSFLELLVPPVRNLVALGSVRPLRPSARSVSR